MDILKFLSQGNVSANPDYNPKTKKGALEPPTLVNFKPGTTPSDQGRNVLGQTLARNQYDLNQYDIDKYSEYDVYVGPNTPQEELDKERAKNQSVLEQGMKMIGQIGNEMTLGTAVGIADLADVIYQALSGQLDNTDYQNEFINNLEGFKESINEQLEIYRKNPNAAFDITDFGWWASNAPSIASTVSLMVPGIGVSKGLSVIGKGIGAATKGTRLAKNALKARNAILRTQKSREIASHLGEAATSGLTMRLLENYQEARQTYNDVHDYAIEQLSSMNDTKRTEFLANNPQYVNKTDEEIAEDVAKNSADVTFEMDWMNAAFDVMQMYGLRNIYKGALRGSSTASMRNLNTMAAKMFGNEGKAVTEAIANQTLWAKTKQGLGNFLRDSMTGVRAEWTEGIEEAVNYISQQEGMYAGKKVFDRDIEKNTINDYLKDPHMWEQAFWGALGGVAFSTIGSRVGEFAQKKLNKDWQTAEKQHEAEILGRAARFTEYKNQIDLINQDKNPFLTTEDESGNKINPDIIGSKEELIAIAEKEYIDNMVVDAANAGNLDLLKDFVRDNNVAKGFQEKLGINANEATQMQQRMLERIESTEQVYNNIINKVNELGGSFEVGKIIASKQVRANNLANQYDQLINWSNNNINTEMSNPANTVTPEMLADAELGIINYHIENLRKAIKNTQNDPTISKARKNEVIAEYEAQIDGLVNQYNFNNYTEENIKNFTNNAFALKRTNKDLYNALYGKINAIRGKVNNAVQVNNSEQYLQKEITYLNNFFDKARVKIVEGAETDLKKMYNKYSINEVDNVIVGQEVESVSNEDKKIIKNAYDALNISALGNAFLENRLTEFKRSIEAEKGREAAVEEPERTDDAADDTVEETTEEVVIEESPSPTGGLEESIPMTPPEVAIPDEVPPPVREETIEPESPVAQEPTPSEPQVNLPSEDDVIGRTAIANDAINAYMAMNNVDINNDDEVRSHLNGMITAVQQLGFTQEEAKQYVNDVVDELTFSYSSVDDTPSLNRTAVLGILTREDAYFEQLINDFVNSVDPSGNPRGRVINGITYVSIGQLAAFLNESSNRKSIYNLLFEAMKNYLFDATRRKTNIRLIDSAELEDIRNNPSAFTNYVDEIIRQRYDALKDGITNRVNVTDLANSPDYKFFIEVKAGDELTTQIDHIMGRIIIKHNNNPIGYLGIPNVDSRTGNYIADNEGWYYVLGLNNSIVNSGFKDAVMRMFVGDKADEQFISSVYNVAIDIAINNGNINAEIRQKLLTMWSQMKSIYPEIVNNFGKAIIGEDAQVKAMHHIVKITEVGLFGSIPQEESINNWFNKLYESYAQATNIVKGNFDGKIIVNRINYGNLNNPINGQEFNTINDTVIGYDESINQIGIAYGGQMTYSNESLTVDTKATTGVSQMRIAKPDGTFMNANLQFVKLADSSVSKDAQQIVSAAISTIQELIERFITNNVDYNFTQLINDINDIINANIGVKGYGPNHKNKKSLFRNVSCDIVPNQRIIFKLGNNVLFAINATQNSITTKSTVGELAHSITSNGYNSYRKDAILTDEFKKFLIDNLRESFRNVMFASSVSLINDKTRENDTTTNKFVKRVNGKTIIDFGDDRTWEFNSFQDMLVSTNSVKINLRNTEGEGFAGNWKYNKDTTRLTINYEIKPADFVNVTEVTSDEVNNMLADKPTDLNDYKNVLSSEDLQIGLTEFFKEDKYVVDYINDLAKLGLIPKTIKLQNGMTKSGKQVNAKYDNKKDVIVLNTKKLAGRQYGQTLRTIVHESIHQKLNNYYDRTEVYKQILPIFEQFREAVRNGDVQKLDANIADYLFGLTDDNIDLTNNKHRESLEEFFVESMTAKRLMDVLNQIEDKTSTTEKKQNLFTKLIEIIAKMFGIKINEDSLLATARDIYSNISERQIIEGQISTETTQPVQTKIPFTAEESSNEEISSKSEQELEADDDAEYSSVEDIEIPNLYSLMNNIPYKLRADFNEMVSTGQLSYGCM